MSSPPKRVLVIGGGPSGLVALRNLTVLGKDHGIERVELVERRDDIGGVWYLDDPTRVPEKPHWPSPAYPSLIGNVLPEFLSFNRYPFPEPPTTPHQPFPTLKETYDYLRGFAEPYIKSGQIRLGHEVVSVEELPDNAGWNVKFKDWSNGWDGVERDEVWNAVVVAVGWYDNPVWPNTPGLSELIEKGLARHAKSWRGPVGLAGKRALIIGNANSSNDIAAHLAPVAQRPVYRSVRHTAFPGFPSLPDERIEDVAPVQSYDLDTTTNKVTAHLENGTIIKDIDQVIVGTGYRPYPSFIHVRTEGQLAPLMNGTISPHRIPSVHRHILYALNTSLAFIGSFMAYTPFTVNDIASSWLALVWTGEIAIPDTLEARLVFEKERLEAIEEGRKEWAEKMIKAGEHDNRAMPTSFLQYSVLAASEEGYAGGLREEVVKARPEWGGTYVEWNEERRVWRERMFPMKFAALKWARENKIKGGTEI
ncbi:flavin dependent monooxygenase [Moniliophthora roreri MCA 2997]|uniref:Flavin dependent monooxygenase n=1 Tax=Moniliophthora roreri (strain MCA 2997) TaxID=1381753 RepID=V2X070_MONRO|nr:flavin dependent monooxygenase [Moniliophthora roreri MCA 2997]